MNSTAVNIQHTMSRSLFYNFIPHSPNSTLLKYPVIEVTSICWSDNLGKIAWMQFEWRVTDHSDFIVLVDRVTEAAATTSVLLRAAADGGEADWVKWIALSHKSISDALHKVCLQPSCCMTEPKQTRERGFKKRFPPLSQSISFSFSP